MNKSLKKRKIKNNTYSNNKKKVRYEPQTKKKRQTEKKKNYRPNPRKIIKVKCK